MKRRDFLKLAQGLPLLAAVGISVPVIAKPKMTDLEMREYFQSEADALRLAMTRCSPVDTGRLPQNIVGDPPAAMINDRRSWTRTLGNDPQVFVFRNVVGGQNVYTQV